MLQVTLDAALGDENIPPARPAARRMAPDDSSSASAARRVDATDPVPAGEVALGAQALARPQDA